MLQDNLAELFWRRFLAKVEKWKSVIDFVGIKQNNLMESNPGDGKACKLKAFVALPEALLMPEKILVTVTDLRRTTNISLFPDGGIKRQHSCLNSTDLP